MDDFRVADRHWRERISTCGQSGLSKAILHFAHLAAAISVFVFVAEPLLT